MKVEEGIGYRKYLNTLTGFEAKYKEYIHCEKKDNIWLIFY